MTTINFKSVGLTPKKVLQTAITGSIIPIGIVTPLRHGNNNEGLFAMHTRTENQIADNLRNLLLTNNGERLIKYDLGANLHPLLFEIASSKDGFDDEATTRIKQVVSKYMPYIQLQTFTSTIINNDNLHTGKIKINISYNVPALNISEAEIEVMMNIT